MDRLPELDDAVQDLSETLDRRLVVIDHVMQVVAYSIHETPADRRRLFHILTHSGSWPRPHTAKSSHAVITLPEIGTMLFLRLLDARRRIVGHVVLPWNDTDPEHGPDPALEETAAHLGELLAARQHDVADRAARTYQLTADLVTGSAGERDAAAEALITERLLSTSESYCAVALGVDPRGATPLDHERTAHAVSRTLRFVRETSTATVVGGVLEEQVGVLVFPRPVVAARLTRILKDPAVTPVQAGIGPVVPLDEVHRSFEQARLAWRATWLAPDDHETVSTWEGMGLDGTLARLPLEHFRMADLPPSTRDLLAAVDSPDLLTTLETYLVAGGDAARTARLLRIHRSTLYYRLDKLRSILAGDLNDGVFRRDLHTGLRMARLAGLVPRPGKSAPRS
ncbi:PucR family transcriptional regulator [Corynebacterium halotolerans]|uniref:PucR family transcriptional regulator n=1 Tax=Corynebacterium halotolerans TaxID=225326 RepID=UPI003CF9D8BF